MFALLLQAEHNFLHPFGWWSWDSGNKTFTLWCLWIVIIEEFVFWSHGVWLHMLIKYNWLLKILTKIMGIYECFLPWYFFRSCFRNFLIWKMCSFTKLYKKNHLGSRWGLIIIVSVIIVWWQVQLVETVISREQTSWFPVVKCS